MTALTDFEARAEEVAALLDRIHPGWFPERQSAPSGVVPKDLSVGVLARSSLVLLVSYFEGFLKDLADEAFDRILESNVPCERLSGALRGQAVLQHVRRLRTSTDASEIWESVTELGNLGQALNGKSPITASLLPRDQIKREVTSIEPAKINSLLRALNDRDLNRGPMSKHGERLRGLKQIRDNAVHGNEQDLPALGFADVSGNLTLLLACAKDMQDRVDALLADITAPASGVAS